MSKIPRLLIALVSVFLSLGLSPTLFSQTSAADSFDKPLKKIVMDLGPSPYSPGGKVRVKLSCYSYPTFVIKQYDEGEKGAEWIAIIPTTKGALPPCTRGAAAGERRIDGAEWSGYFKGAKDNLVFIDGADGVDRGLPFVVYDSTTGVKLFEDSAYAVAMGNSKANELPAKALRVSRAADGHLHLRYLRVVEAGCDLHLEKAPCWERARNKFELKSTELPVCSGYAGISDREVSAIAYPVEVVLLPKPSIHAVAGPTKCWPVD